MFRPIFSVSHCRRTFLGNPFVFQSFSASKKLMQRGLLRKLQEKQGGRSESHIFAWNNCGLTVPKIFVGHPFSISTLSWFRKKLLRGQAFSIFCQGVARFPVDSFMSHSTEFFVGEPIKLPESSGY